MSLFARNVGSAAVAIAASFAFTALGACGGRSNDSEVGYPDEDSSDSGAPAPTCAEMCRAVVDRCVPGGDIQECAADCDVMKKSHPSCAAVGELLRCLAKAPVACSPEKLTIEGCNSEWNALSSCSTP